jgi:hypothetical protein
MSIMMNHVHGFRPGAWALRWWLNSGSPALYTLPKFRTDVLCVLHAKYTVTE